MDVNQADQARDQLQIVDVREPYEWEAGRIDGAIHIPQGELPQRLGEIDRDRLVLTVCRSGGRSADAADLLTARGYRAVSLEGGMHAWADAGLPFSAADGGPGTVA